MSALIPYFISGGGFAGMVAVAFMLGLIHSRSSMEDKERQLEAKDRQIEKLEEALRLERARSDAAVLAAGVVKDVMGALRKEIAQ